MKHKVELPGYSIDSGLMDEGSWSQYEATKKAHHFDRDKVHISISHDIETINKAKELILPVLAAHRVYLFKVVNTYRFRSEGNIDGKEFCIYMQTWNKNSPEGDPAFWINLLNEIESILESNNIPKHPKGALGDMLFPGSKGYVYYRNAHNVGGEYVAASDLALSGFTKSEACNISTNDFFSGYSLIGNGSILATEETPSPAIQTFPDSRIEEKKDIKQAVIEAFHAQLTRNDKLLRLFVGDSGHYASNGLLCDLLFGTRLSSDKKYHALSQARAGGLDLISPFQKYLERAAEKIAKIAFILEKNGFVFDPQKTGAIFPALYFHFYVPLYLKNDRHLDMSAIDETALVNELVRCSLRDTAKNAIDYELPQYIHNFNEETVSTLLSVVDFCENPPSDVLEQPLSEQLDHFSELVQTVSTIVSEEKEEASDAQIVMIAENLTLQLNNERAGLGDNPEQEDIDKFSRNCKEIIVNSAPELKKDPKLWSRVHPALKGILGVLAALTIIPAVIVAVSTKKGYIATFFTTCEVDQAAKTPDYPGSDSQITMAC